MWVQDLIADHAAHFRLRNNLVAGLSGKSACYELMMCALILGLFKSRMILFNDTDADVRMMFNAVDFIKRHPVFNFVAVTLKDSSGKLQIKKSMIFRFGQPLYSVTRVRGIS